MVTIKKHTRKTKKGRTTVKRHGRKVKKKSTKDISDITFDVTKRITKDPLNPNIIKKSQPIQYKFVEGVGLVRKKSREMIPYGSPTMGQKFSRLRFKPREGYVVVGTTNLMKRDLRKRGLLD